MKNTDMKGLDHGATWCNNWECPMIMSCLSTESTLNWGFVRVKEMATLLETICFWLSRLL